MNNVKPFPAELLSSILSQIDQYQAKNPGPYYAAFDADGTLWNTDVGENFFQYQIDECNLAALKSVDPWHHYETLKLKNKPEAYLWLAQISAGHPFTRVQEWTRAAVSKNPPPVFPSQKQLIDELKKRKVQVYIVTASVQWAVEAAAHAVGLSPENVLGIRTAVKDGIVTTDQFGPITWQPGKPEALLKVTGGVAPIFCAGNTSGDIHLLRCSQLVRLAVQSQGPTTKDRDLFEDEQKLLTAARAENWLHHSFCL